MLRYIFVLGLAVWGGCDERFQEKPYWGMRGGDSMQYLRGKGFAAPRLRFLPMAARGIAPVSSMRSLQEPA